MPLRKVKIFTGFIGDIEAIINEWASSHTAEIIDTSMTAEAGGRLGHVFVIVVYESDANQPQSLQPQ